ncbi:MAG: hypothetical protein ACO1N8_06500 [Methylophilus sp.]|jgi:hypothetical protein
MTTQQKGNTTPVTLEQMVAKTCFCKLREYCEDKNSVECMRNRNIYAEFMAKKHSEHLG